MKPFIAMIVPMGEAPGGGGGNPPGIWGPTDPRPGWGLPGGEGGGGVGGPPGIWGPTDPRPTHPIAGVPGGGGQPGQPPGIWGGGNVPMPNPPIHLGPGGEVGGPPGIWGGANQPFPTPPIFIPSPRPPEMPPADILEPGSFLVIAKDENGQLSWVKMTPGGKPPTTPQPKPGEAQQGQQFQPGQPGTNPAANTRPPTAQSAGTPPKR